MQPPDPTPIRVVVPGMPVAWGRPRVKVTGGRPRFFEAPNPTAQRKKIAAAFEGLAPESDMQDIPFSLSCEFRFPVPKSWPKWKRSAALAGNLPHTKKPDVDNLLKLVGDALNGVAWNDDKQIIDASARKLYDDQPATIIVIRPVLFVAT